MLYSELHWTPCIGSWELVGDLGHSPLLHISPDIKSILLKTEAPLCRTRGPTRSPPSSTHVRSAKEWLHCISQWRPQDGAVVLAGQLEDAGERESLAVQTSDQVFVERDREARPSPAAPDLACVSTPAKTTCTVTPPPDPWPHHPWTSDLKPLFLVLLPLHLRHTGSYVWFRSSDWIWPFSQISRF